MSDHRKSRRGGKGGKLDLRAVLEELYETPSPPARVQQIIRDALGFNAMEKFPSTRPPHCVACGEAHWVEDCPRSIADDPGWVRCGTDPRPGNLGLIRPSHWDGRGFSPWFLYGIALFVVFAVALLSILAAT